MTVVMGQGKAMGIPVAAQAAAPFASQCSLRDLRALSEIARARNPALISLLPWPI